MNNSIDLVRKMFIKDGFDALLITNFYNIMYLSGFKGLSPDEREGWLFITKETAYFFTDARYSFEAQHTIQSLTISPEYPLKKQLSDIVAKEKIKIIGFEDTDLKYAEHTVFANSIASSFKPIPRYVSQMRQIKSNDEIRSITKACNIIDDYLTAIIPTINVGQTEKEIAFNIEFWLKKHDYDFSFYPIVACDENTAIPHYDTRTNGTKKVGKNSIILIDCGAKYNNYCSDITRMVVMGKPTNVFINAYNTLLSIQQDAIAMISRTKNYSEIDKKVRKDIEEKGYPSMPHSTGHGVGLEIHESPRISSNSQDMIVPNQIVTIEPGIYVPGKFGIRIEDTVLVSDRKAIPLTKSEKNL